MDSTIIKRSIALCGHKTSVSLEDEFWMSLREIAKARDTTLSELIGVINAERQHANLSSAIRLFVLGSYRDRLATREQVSSRPDGTLQTSVP
jgi:predicted DNA-binding ribbon-helix-helix protein